jgi:hypothetical protein
MGQNSEEAAEFVATVRGDHAAMKAWYNESSNDALAALKQEYGAYPDLWKQVLNWPGWKAARKEYLKHIQQKEGSSGGGGSNNSTSNDSSNNNNSNTEGIPRKRKSRWGTKTNSNEAPANGGQPPEKRPSTGPGTTSGAAAAASALPSIIAGNDAHLTPAQQQEVARLQAQLRRVNERIDNLEKEAARVDALPRGHRDRSPSPPPGKYDPHLFFRTISHFPALIHPHSYSHLFLSV